MLRACDIVRTLTVKYRYVRFSDICRSFVRDYAGCLEVIMRYSEAIVAGSLFVALIGCQGPLASATQYDPASAAQTQLPTVGPESEPCGGSGRVKVRPCPVTLTKKHPTVEVMVAGPGVVDSAEKTNSKNRSGCGHICEVGQSFSSPLDYDVSAGSKCGSVAIYFYGYDGGGNTVGVGRLKVVNKACP